MKILFFVMPVEKEVQLKIAKEIMALYNVEIDPTATSPDFYRLELVNSHEDNGTMTSRLYLQRGQQLLFAEHSLSGSQDAEPAEMHRLFKLNLFYLFQRQFGKVNAPWGILHGVRPTKIVQRYIENDLTAPAICTKLENDYAVSAAKAELLTKIAYRQLPIIESSTMRTVSIYIGIPFCVSRCLYCSFPSNLLPSDHSIIEHFLASLEQEMRSLCNLLERYRLTVQTVYIGGGTPTSLAAADFALLLAAVRRYFGNSFVEFTVEAGRPDTIDLAKIESMQKQKVTRISVNPQTMQLKTLQLIGRSHTPQDIIKIYQQIRQYTTAKINMDTIIGLPSETLADVRSTFEQILALQPDDITVHALAIKKGSRLKLLKDDIKLPDDSAACQMGELVEQLLRNNDYLPYYLYRQGYMSGQLENIGYCRDRAWSIYNIQIMSEQQTILGIGCNASTKVIFQGSRGKYLKTLFNPKDLATYFNSLPSYIERRRQLVDSAYGTGDF